MKVLCIGDDIQYMDGTCWDGEKEGRRFLSVGEKENILLVSTDNSLLMQKMKTEIKEYDFSILFAFNLTDIVRLVEFLRENKPKEKPALLFSCGCDSEDKISCVTGKETSIQILDNKILLEDIYFNYLDKVPPGEIMDNGTDFLNLLNSRILGSKSQDERKNKDIQFRNILLQKNLFYSIKIMFGDFCNRLSGKSPQSLIKEIIRVVCNPQL